jgi:hypothetical protein
MLMRGLVNTSFQVEMLVRVVKEMLQLAAFASLFSPCFASYDFLFYLVNYLNPNYV